MMGCLAFCDARTLRELKAVSVAYRRRARQTLGDATSPWRKHPVWSTSARGDGLAADLAHASVGRRRDALEAMRVGLDGAVGSRRRMPLESSRSSRTGTRLCVLRDCMLGELEPAVLALYADAIVARLADEDSVVRQWALETLGQA